MPPTTPSAMPPEVGMASNCGFALAMAFNALGTVVDKGVMAETRVVGFLTG
jgi:hypothetical protein